MCFKCPQCEKIEFRPGTVFRVCRKCASTIWQSPEDDKVNIKITISGDRACGKTVMTRYLQNILESLGAEVKVESQDLNGNHLSRGAHESFLNRMDKAPKRFDKQRITIVDQDICAHAGDQIDIAKRNLKVFAS